MVVVVVVVVVAAEDRQQEGRESGGCGCAPGFDHDVCVVVGE